MSYTIILREKAKEDIAKLKKTGDKSLVKKLGKLLGEIVENPRVGTGKPEQLRHYANETWSRRLSDKHRLVYTIEEQIVTVEIVSAYGHYDDK